MMFALAAPAGSRLITPSAANTKGIETWATKGADGHTRVVLINESGNLRTVAINAPASKTATLERLRAPRLTSTSGVTLGGQSFGGRPTPGTCEGDRGGEAQPEATALRLHAPRRQRGPNHALSRRRSSPALTAGQSSSITE